MLSYLNILEHPVKQSNQIVSQGVGIPYIRTYLSDFPYYVKTHRKLALSKYDYLSYCQSGMRILR